jgi:triphosphatase
MNECPRPRGAFKERRLAIGFASTARDMAQQFEFKLGEQGRFTLQSGALTVAPPRRSHALAVKARAAILPREIAAEDAFRITLQQCKWHIAANVDAVVASREVEGVHQMRVGLRRLRVALSAFGDDFRTPALDALGQRARKLAAKLAPARDLDVFVEELLEPAAQANGAVEAFEHLRARAFEARRVAWDYAVAHVQGPSFPALLHDLDDALDRRVWYGANHSPLAFEMPAREIADRMLAQRLKAAARRARRFNTLSDHQRHRLRIALKKLRYTAEFFAPLYESGATQTFQRKLARMQDSLGALNDVAVARETLNRLVAAPPRADLSFAAGIVYGWHLDRAGHIAGKGKKRWKEFAKTERFWEN